MSDAMTEAYQGTYFKDRSTTNPPPKVNEKIIKKVGNNVDFFNIYNN